MPKITKRNALALQSEAKRLVPAGQKRGLELLSLIARKKIEIADALYDVGDALRELEKKRLYVALGHQSFDDMLEKRSIMSRSQAFKLLAIRDSKVTREQAIALGQDKTYALCRYAKATAGPDSVPLLLERGISVEGKLRSVDKLTVAQITRAAQKTRTARNNARRDPARHAAEALAEQTRRDLSRRGFRGIDIRAYRTGGVWRARFDLPIADLERIFSA